MSSRRPIEEVRAERTSRRLAATRYTAGLLLWKEVNGWLRAHVPDHVHQGRLQGDLLVTREAFDDAPGDDVQSFTNGLGATVYRKKLLVSGAIPVEIRLIYIASAATSGES